MINNKHYNNDNNRLKITPSFCNLQLRFMFLARAMILCVWGSKTNEKYHGNTSDALKCPTEKNPKTYLNWTALTCVKCQWSVKRPADWVSCRPLRRSWRSCCLSSTRTGDRAPTSVTVALCPNTSYFGRKLLRRLFKHLFRLNLIKVSRLLKVPGPLGGSTCCLSFTR